MLVICSASRSKRAQRERYNAAHYKSDKAGDEIIDSQINEQKFL